MRPLTADEKRDQRWRGTYRKGMVPGYYRLMLWMGKGYGKALEAKAIKAKRRRRFTSRAAYERARRFTPKVQARRRLQRAVASGAIVKPDVCLRCWEPTPQHLLHGHHEDHGQPLNVVWLCPRCHAAIDPTYARCQGTS